MIRYISHNLKSFPLFLRLQNVLHFFEPIIFRKYWDLYSDYCTKLKRTTGNIYFREEEGAINVIGIKRDPEISFNLGDAFYNDVLVIAKNVINDEGKKDLDFYIYKVTMDPKDKSDKIAHLLMQVSNSYVRRPHRWIPGRTAICQDKNSVLIARTDSKGNVINAAPYKGFFGINIHDSDRWINSSLGCTVLEKDSKENGFHYKESFKPLLKTISNIEDITYAVSSLDAIENIYFTEIEPQIGKKLKPAFKPITIDYNPPFMKSKSLKWWWEK